MANPPANVNFDGTNLTYTNAAGAQAPLALSIPVSVGGVAPSGGGGGTGGTGGGGTGGGIDTNVYPLTVPKPGSPDAPPAGADVILGTGPQWIEYIACTGNDGPGKPRTDPNSMSCFAIKLDTGLVIAGPLYVATSTGEDGGQKFRINGAWGPGHDFTIEPGGDAQNLNDQWYNGTSQDFTVCEYNGPATSGNGQTEHVLKGWNEGGMSRPMLWSSKAVVVVQPPPPADSTVITGATINLVATPPATLDALIALSPVGSLLTLPEGTFTGTSTINKTMTVTGVNDAAGVPLTKISGLGLRLANQKAIFVPQTGGVTLENMELMDAAVSDADGADAAGVRNDGPGYGFTLNNIIITRCQDGILSFGGGTMVCNKVSTLLNGAGNHGGATHEMYWGGGSGSVVKLTAQISVCGILSTHALKSRAEITTDDGGTYTGNGDDGTNGGSVIDIPDGGRVTFTTTRIIVKPGAANHGIFTYGEESATNAAAGTVVTWNQVVVDDADGQGFISNGSNIPTATLILNGCTYTGPNTPQLVGWASVTGTFTKAAAPGTPGT